MHSVFSDGELTPDQLATAAKAAGLDFLATTEHNSADAHGAWGSRRARDLLVVLGEEVTTKTGHWLALGIGPGQVIGWEYGVRDGLIDKYVAEVHDAGGICVAAHPYAPYPSGDFMYPYPGFDLVEVWNGLWVSDRPWNADNESALAEWGRGLAADIPRGQWRPAIGNSDTHLRGQIGIPHTVVLAEELSSEAILSGLSAGRSWVAESTAVELFFTASVADRRAGVGERLRTLGEQVAVRAHVRGVPSATVSFHADRGKVRRQTLPHHGSGTAEWDTNAEESRFVRIEVRHPQGHMAALTNPIILG